LRYAGDIQLLPPAVVLVAEEPERQPARQQPARELPEQEEPVREQPPRGQAFSLGLD